MRWRGKSRPSSIARSWSVAKESSALGSGRVDGGSLVGKLSAMVLSSILSRMHSGLRATSRSSGSREVCGSAGVRFRERDITITSLDWMPSRNVAPRGRNRGIPRTPRSVQLVITISRSKHANTIDDHCCRYGAHSRNGCGAEFHRRGNDGNYRRTEHRCGQHGESGTGRRHNQYNHRSSRHQHHDRSGRSEYDVRSSR